METRTKHTCNDGYGPSFGRKTPGCPRCEELLSGAEPRQGWGHKSKYSGATTVKHDCKVSKCGPICTHGEW